MTPPVVAAFKWREPGYRKSFGPRHVHNLRDGIERHYGKPHRFVCITDDAEALDCESFPLWPDLADVPNPTKGRPSCFRRLKLFEPEMQASLGVAPGQRLIWIDLDAVVVGDLAPLWDRPEDLVIWRDQAYRPGGPVSPYNGSMLLLRGGAHPEVWGDFDAAAIRAAGLRGSDQAWLALALGPDMPVWDKQHGVLWSRRVAAGLPRGARIVFFCGTEDPSTARAPWARAAWR